MISLQPTVCDDGRTMAWLADALTASRLILAPLLGVLVATQRYSVAVVVLVVAWLTDSLDGACARVAGGGTRLGVWDFRIDLLLGIALLIGLAAAHRIPLWSAALVIFGGAGGVWMLGNPAPGMLLMTVSYLLFFGVLVSDQPPWWWLILVAIPAMVLIERRRTVTIILPAFFRSMARLGGRSGQTAPILDAWAQVPRQDPPPTATEARLPSGDHRP